MKQYFMFFHVGRQGFVPLSKGRCLAPLLEAKLSQFYGNGEENHQLVNHQKMILGEGSF